MKRFVRRVLVGVLAFFALTAGVAIAAPQVLQPIKFSYLGRLYGGGTYGFGVITATNPNVLDVVENSDHTSGTFKLSYPLPGGSTVSFGAGLGSCTYTIEANKAGEIIEAKGTTTKRVDGDYSETCAIVSVNPLVLQIQITK